MYDYAYVGMWVCVWCYNVYVCGVSYNVYDSVYKGARIYVWRYDI